MVLFRGVTGLSLLVLTKYVSCMLWIKTSDLGYFFRDGFHPTVRRRSRFKNLLGVVQGGTSARV